MIEIEPIGVVENRFKKPTDFEDIRQEVSKIVLKEEFEDGLYKIENNDYLKILYYFDRSDGYKLVGKRRHGEERGVFASRSPHRPVGIGDTTVKLLEKEGRVLKVKGLDAISGTPVLDIKPYAKGFDEPNK